jgi:hypothetical protein
MNIAIKSDTTNGFYSSYLEPVGQIVALDFGYHPGFEAGFTLNTPYDKWVLGGDYLWVRAQTQASATATGSIYYQGTSALEDLLAAVKATWNVGLDLADLYLARPFYLGKNWTVEPCFGLQGGWIRQSLQITETPNAAAATAWTSQQRTLRSNCWGIGPSGGFQTNWMLGKGVSLFGNLSASLLYTNYTTLSQKTTLSTGKVSRGSNNGWNSVKPNLNTGMGVQWGTYFSDQDYYFNLSAAYNFMVFFAQNEISAFAGFLLGSSGISPGNLFLHGVSVSASLLF